VKYRDLQLTIGGRADSRYERIREHREAAVALSVLQLRQGGAVDAVGYAGYIVTHAGCVYSTNNRRLVQLRPGVKPGGYQFVGLNCGGGRKYEMVHRLVAKAFIPNPDDLPEINHLDGDKLNNSVENLEWCDRSANQRHMVAMLGIAAGGGKHPHCKLVPEQVREIRALNGRYRDIAVVYGVSAQTVCNVKRGSQYGDVA
jgi:hypothetical protein